MDYRAEIMSLEERNPSGCQGALVPGIIAKGKGPKFIVFGLNPAEAKDDKEEFYGTEFYIFDREKSETLSQRRWSKKIADILPVGAEIIQAEIVYWTSKDRRSLEKKIGKLDFGNPYFDLSRTINDDLLSRNSDAKCILLGFTHKDLFEKLFNLPELDTTITGQDGKNLVYKNTRSSKFFSVRHPSAFGMSNLDKDLIKKTLADSM